MERKDPLAKPAPKARRERLVHRAPKARLARRDRVGIQASKAPKAYRETKAHRASRAKPDPPERMVPLAPKD
jgi:hypothetical protein